METCSIDLPLANFPAQRFEKGVFSSIAESVIKESRLALFVNGNEIVRLLFAPLDPKYLVKGFLLSECLISGPDDIKELNFNPKSMSVDVKLREELPEHLFEAVRSVTTGCGRGLTFVPSLFSDFFPQVAGNSKIAPDIIISLMRNLQRISEVFRKTGGVHSAAIADGDKILFACDDIGRHNAVDKILGWQLEHRWPSDESLLLLSTGRISSEIVTKAVRGRFPILVSPSAPTSGAIQVAESLGVTVIGFARGERFNIYTHAHRIIGS
ncbi:MAG: formate dehydrogenase accessory sulfurtransferase FdhD [Candidatus Ozemobacteraceae bacterium]